MKDMQKEMEEEGEVRQDGKAAATAAASASSLGDQLAPLVRPHQVSKTPSAVVPSAADLPAATGLKWLHAGLLFSVGWEHQRPT